jgi:uncharacterized membrane protein YfcA
MDFTTLILTAILGFSSGFVGSIVGGFGIISIPGLIFLGLAPQFAIATTRFATIGATLVGIHNYKKAGKIDFKLSLKIMIAISLGTFIGSNLLLMISNEVLGKLIGIALLPMSFLILYKKKLGTENSVKEVVGKEKLFGYLIFIIIGIWGGMITGGGILTIYMFLIVFRKSFLESVGTLHLMGLAFVIISVPVFAIFNLINYSLGFILMVSATFGGYVGSSLALKKGDKWVRIFFLIVVLVSAVKLLWFS